MEKSDFSRIWKHIVLPKIKEIALRNMRQDKVSGTPIVHQYLDVPFHDKQEFDRWNAEVKEQVRVKLYDYIIELQATQFNFHGDADTLVDQRLFDRHKIAALFILALIDVYPIRLKVRLMRVPWHSAMANYMLALHAGMYIVLHYDHKKNSGQYEFSSFRIQYPESGYRNFEQSFYFMLHSMTTVPKEEDILGRNVLKLSNILFLIEKLNAAHIKMAQLESVIAESSIQ